MQTIPSRCFLKLRFYGAISRCIRDRSTPSQLARMQQSPPVMSATSRSQTSVVLLLLSRCLPKLTNGIVLWSLATSIPRETSRVASATRHREATERPRLEAAPAWSLLVDQSLGMRAPTSGRSFRTMQRRWTAVDGPHKGFAVPQWLRRFPAHSPC
jgi:hypothetical protein